MSTGKASDRIVSGRKIVADAGGASSIFQQTFTEPGSWVNPGSVTGVDVLLVGGGGGGGYGTNPFFNPPAQLQTIAGGGGGGGGVRSETDVPVPSSPVPVVVGAGGAGGSWTPAPTIPWPGAQATPGGDSSFGTITVGGGGHGSSAYWTNITPTTIAPAGDAPPIGGGGGSATYGSPLTYGTQGDGGQYGYPGGVYTGSTYTTGGGAGSPGITKFPSTTNPTIIVSHRRNGVDGFGGGGTSGASPLGSGAGLGSDGGGTSFVHTLPHFGSVWRNYANGRSNTGGGGAGGSGMPSYIGATPTEPAGTRNGGHGGSGVVVVTWVE